jgi:hypothetical protein
VEWGGGGAGGSNDSPLARIDVPPDHVDLSGTVAAGGERGCKALWGEVGVSAAVAEVEQAGRVTRRPVEAPIGAFVMCADLAHPFTVRVMDADGRLLATVEEPAGFADELT